MSAVAISALDIAVPATRGDHAGTVGPFYRDAAASVEVVMNIHVLIGNVHVTDFTVGARAE
jgi:hypothetical protein